MTEQEFINKLSDKLTFLPVEDQAEIVESYQQQFIEMRAEGKTDQQIISAIEPIDVIVENVRKEFDISKQAEYQAKAKKQYNTYRSKVNDFLNKEQNANNTTEKSGNSKVKHTVSDLLTKIWKLAIIIDKVIAVAIFITVLISTVLTIPLALLITSLSTTLVIMYGVLFLFELVTFILTYRLIKYIGGKV